MSSDFPVHVDNGGTGDVRQEPLRGEIDTAARTNALAEAFFGSEGQSIHNFQGNPLEVYQFESRCQGAEVADGANFPDDGIELEYVYCINARTINQQTKEVQDFIRTVLVAKGGDMYGFGSDGVWKSLLPLLKIYKFQKIDPPCRVRLEKIKTGGKRVMFRIVPV